MFVVLDRHGTGATQKPHEHAPTGTESCRRLSTNTGWRISHRTHHGNHGHIENDESWYPVSESYYKNEMDSPSKAVRFELPLVLIAYQIYLFRRTPGKDGSHFDPSCDLFKPSERNMILQSTAACLAMVAILAGVGMKFGFVFLLNTYLIPHLIFCAWLVAVTYLHHTGKPFPLQQSAVKYTFGSFD